MWNLLRWAVTALPSPCLGNRLRGANKITGIFYGAPFVAKPWEYWKGSQCSAECQEILSKGKGGEALE